MDRAELEKRISGIRALIGAAALRTGRDPEKVTIVAVTKTHPVDVVRTAVEAGLTHIGENKVQEAVGKLAEIGELRSRFSMHLIGRLQSNKAKQAVRHFDVIHSVDSLKLAQELQRHCTALTRQISVLMQVNISGEHTKSGFEPAVLRKEFPVLLETCPGLSVAGFMTMAPFSDNPQDARPHFRNLRLLAEELRTTGAAFSNNRATELSMGMTNDFEVAVEEGATLVRIGTALFGAR